MYPIRVEARVRWKPNGVTEIHSTPSEARWSSVLPRTSPPYPPSGEFVCARQTPLWNAAGVGRRPGAAGDGRDALQAASTSEMVRGCAVSDPVRVGFPGALDSPCAPPTM